MNCKIDQSNAANATAVSETTRSEIPKLDAEDEDVDELAEAEALLRVPLAEDAALLAAALVEEAELEALAADEVAAEACTAPKLPPVTSSGDELLLAEEAADL